MKSKKMINESIISVLNSPQNKKAFANDDQRKDNIYSSTSE